VAKIVATLIGDEAELVPAATLQAARECIEQTGFDLVILDIGLPDGSGLDLLPLLNTRTHHVPVIVFSAYELGDVDAEQVSAALVKARASNDELLNIIRTALCDAAQSPAPGDKRDETQ